SQGQIIDRTNVDILGVDPETFGSVAFFRRDYAGPSLNSLLDTLAADAPKDDGLAIPAGAQMLGVWVNPVDPKGRVGLEAEVRDATGRYFSFNLGPDNGLEMQPGWYFMAADLSRPTPGNGATSVTFPTAPPQEPLVLTSVAIRFLTRVSAQSGTMLLDDLQV